MIRTPPDTPWHCLSCHTAGLTTGTESGADVKHTKSHGHPTTTGLDAAALARVSERVQTVAAYWKKKTA
jgi:hypothetical protein